MTQSTKKLDCPAVIAVKKVAKFPDFKEEMHPSNWTRRKTVKEITQYVKAGHEVDVAYEYWAKFPAPDAHENHVQGEVSSPPDKILMVDLVIPKDILKVISTLSFHWY